MGASSYFANSNIADLEVPAMEEPDPNATWITGFLGTASYFIENIAFFFTLMTLDTGYAWLGTLVFSPAIVFLMYGILKLIRGGG